jgi:splicing factor 3B subunit 3
MGKYKVVPLSYDTLNYVSAFTSERCTEGGMVALADNSLRIIKVEKLGD